MSMKYYNIHNIVRVSSNVEGYFPKYFECEPLKNVDLEIREGNFKFNKKSHKKIDFKFYGGENKTYFESRFYGRPVYRVLISDLNGKTKFYFNSSTRRFFGVYEIIRMLLEIKLLQKGYTLVHAGGISKGNNGYLLLGWSGVGKSSTIFGSKERGFDVLGDDVVILSKIGKIYCYPQRTGIFFHSENIKDLNLSALERAKLTSRYIVSKCPPFNKWISNKLFIDISNIVNIRDVASLDKMYFLEYGKGSKKLDKKTALNQIIASTLQALFDNYLANKMFYSYCYINGFDSGYIQKNMRKILEKTINNCTIIRSEKKDFYKYIK